MTTSPGPDRMEADGVVIRADTGQTGKRPDGYRPTHLPS
jgi:hypothetical protein